MSSLFAPKISEGKTSSHWWMLLAEFCVETFEFCCLNGEELLLYTSFRLSTLLEVPPQSISLWAWDVKWKTSFPISSFIFDTFLTAVNVVPTFLLSVICFVLRMRFFCNVITRFNWHWIYSKRISKSLFCFVYSIVKLFKFRFLLSELPDYPFLDNSDCEKKRNLNNLSFSQLWRTKQVKRNIGFVKYFLNLRLLMHLFSPH